MTDTTTNPAPSDVLAVPMPQPNDAGAATVRDYLIELLAALWEDGEGFSGKSPLGNSSWQYDLYQPLVLAGFISGSIDEDGYLDECDDAAGDKLIAAAIRALGDTP